MIGYISAWLGIESQADRDFCKYGVEPTNALSRICFPFHLPESMYNFPNLAKWIVGLVRTEVHRLGSVA